MSDTVGAQVWAERQAERYRWLLEQSAKEPERWAARKAALEATGHAFVWDYVTGDMWEFPTSSAPHRVIKRTATRVYVEARGFRFPDAAGDHLTDRAFLLDRAELEREGRAVRRGRSWHETYYAVPYEETPAWHEELAGLRRRFQEMLTPESWLEHRRKVDEYLAAPVVFRA